MRAPSLALLTVAALAGRPLTGQNVARQIAAAPDGEVRFSFASRPEVCGHGNGYSIKGRDRRDRNNVSFERQNDAVIYDDVVYDQDCAYPDGPVRVVLLHRKGAVTKVRTWIGGRWRDATPPGTDLGTVSAPEAARALLGIAGNPANTGGDDAVFPATLADSVVVWSDLLRLARNQQLPKQTRRSSVFWLSQAAGDSATVGLTELAESDKEESEIRTQAVFALSQRPHDEGIPALMRVARTNKDPEVRRSAIFWLGQSDDPRALTLIEDLIFR